MIDVYVNFDWLCNNNLSGPPNKKIVDALNGLEGKGYKITFYSPSAECVGMWTINGAKEYLHKHGIAANAVCSFFIKKDDYIQLSKRITIHASYPVMEKFVKDFKLDG